MRTDVNKELQAYVDKLENGVRAAYGQDFDVDRIEIVLKVRASNPAGKYVDMVYDVSNPKAPKAILLMVIENPGKPHERAIVRKVEGKSAPAATAKPPAPPPPNRAQRRAQRKG